MQSASTHRLEFVAPANPRASTDLDRAIGSRIRVRRSALRLSQEKLAELIGVTFQQIQKYEKGVNRVSAATLYRIAQELRVQIADLMPPTEHSQQTALAAADATLHALAKMTSDLSPDGRLLLVNLARTLTLCERLNEPRSR